MNEGKTMGQSLSVGEAAVRELYRGILDAWNAHDAGAMAAKFAEDGNIVGFDGSQMNGRQEIESQLRQVFRDHVTAAYIAKVRQVRILAPGVALLRAVVGMVPPGQTDINPAVNAVQSLIAVDRGGEWEAALFQNTPAQFHGRPELAEQLGAELRELLAELREK
ncbi:MAG: SgcJ/EcaC family oxidoreductase [Rudaea sp.]